MSMTRGIYVEAHGQKWRVRGKIKEDGRTLKRTIGTYDTEAEAQAAADLCRDSKKVAARPTRRLATAGKSVIEVGRQMLDGENAGRQRRSVFQHIESDIIGTMDVRLVGPPEVSAFKDRLFAKQVTRVQTKKEGNAWVQKTVTLDRTLADQTVRNIINLLSTIFRYAREKGITTGDLLPTQKLGWKRRKKTHLVGWAMKPHELEAFCRAVDGPEKHMFRFLAYTGLRAGEAASLQWRDVVTTGDDPHAWIRYGGPPTMDQRGQYVWPPTKGGMPRRIPLFAEAIEALHAWHAESQAWCDEEGRRNPHRLVFPRQKGGVRDPIHLIKSECWRAAKARAKLGKNVRVHDLRHTCATSLLRGWWGRKWTVKEVQLMLGHADPQTTERYLHGDEEMLTTAAQEMAGLKNDAQNDNPKSPRNMIDSSPKPSPRDALESPKYLKSLSRLGGLNSRPAVYESLETHNDSKKLGVISGASSSPYFPHWTTALFAVREAAIFVLGGCDDEAQVQTAADVLATLALTYAALTGDANIKAQAERVKGAGQLVLTREALRLASMVGEALEPHAHLLLKQVAP